MTSLVIYHLNVNTKFETLSDILFLIDSKIHKSSPSFQFSNTSMYFAYCQNRLANTTNISHNISSQSMIQLLNTSIANSLDVVVIYVNSQKDSANPLNSNIKTKSFKPCVNDLLIFLSLSDTKWIPADNHTGYISRYPMANIIKIAIIHPILLVIIQSFTEENIDDISIHLSHLYVNNVFILFAKITII